MGAGLNGIILNDLEWPLTQVSRSLCTYKSNIGTKLLQNTNRKAHTIYRMVPLSMTLKIIGKEFPDLL